MVPWIGCAGWSLRAELASEFPEEGTHLARYAQRFNAVEINSSFYRPHQTKTYARWAESTPENFRFAVKVPKMVTHEHRLRGVEELLDRFRDEVAGLQGKLGPLLVQLPPSLQFEPADAESFLRQMRDRFDTSIVCEPRHPTWFTSDVESLLVDYRISRVAADPAPILGSAQPAGWAGLQYFRLHGSPRMYYSAYEPSYLTQLAERFTALSEQQIEPWCIFDNTASGAATLNALELATMFAALSRRDA